MVLAKGERLPLPVLWDPTYLRDWKNFNVALEQQFGSNPELAMIGAAGPTSVSDEFTLPDQNSRVTKEWEHQPYQYTVSKYVGAWEEMFNFYKSAVPNQWISLSYGPTYRYRIAPRSPRRGIWSLTQQPLS